MVTDNLQNESVEQYKKEERSAIARRIKGAQDRVDGLLKCMSNDRISTPEKIEQLKMDLYKYTKDKNFKTCDEFLIHQVRRFKHIINQERKSRILFYRFFNVQTKSKPCPPATIQRTIKICKYFLIFWVT